MKWASFPERNLGLVGWNFARESTRALALDFAHAFARELADGAAVPSKVYTTHCTAEL